ncbi:MAG: hypothetical protein ACRCWR_02580 [Saezia sp.]
MEVKDGQITAQQELLNQVTAALHEAQATVNAAQAPHAGSMQRLLEEGKNRKKGYFERFWREGE